MKNLYTTHPHFVRCIIPNELKQTGAERPSTHFPDLDTLTSSLHPSPIPALPLPSILLRDIVIYIQVHVPTPLSTPVIRSHAHSRTTRYVKNEDRSALWSLFQSRPLPQLFIPGFKIPTFGVPNMFHFSIPYIHVLHDVTVYDLDSAQIVGKSEKTDEESVHYTPPLRQVHYSQRKQRDRYYYPGSSVKRTPSGRCTYPVVFLDKYVKPFLVDNV